MPQVVEFLGFNPLQKCGTLAQQIVNLGVGLGLTQKKFVRTIVLNVGEVVANIAATGPDLSDASNLSTFNFV